MARERDVSRRSFLGGSAAGAAAWAMPESARAAVQAAGAKPDDLAIKEVKVYVLKARSGQSVGGATQQLASIVTNSGIEGNYTLATRYFHPNWSNLGWLDYARQLLKGKSALDGPAITSQWAPGQRRQGQSSYASAIDNSLWDILGKASGMPVYRLLGAYKNKVRAYASSQHLKTVDDFVADLAHARKDGFTAYKIHPPWMPNNTVDWELDIEVAKAVRKAAGDHYTLLFDRVGAYTRDEAFKVGRVLDELHYVSNEDPLPTTDMDGLAALTQALDLPITIGEFIFSPYNYADYIRRGCCDEIRFIVDNVGGISGGMKIGRLAELFGMECQPHNWGTALDHAVHFHCELAMPNNTWFEMTQPQGITDQPYFKDLIRIDKDGYVPAPTKPGLGYELDRNVMDNMMVRIDR
jgi:L-alanine-DL-glutamate epimerase-like enolase superfamily enzyme